MGHCSQRSEAEVREIQSAGEGSAFFLEVLRFISAQHCPLAPSMVGEDSGLRRWSPRPSCWEPILNSHAVSLAKSSMR